MYISRRVDIIGPPVWKSTISLCLSKSELASLRLWQSERQRCMLSPLHHHMLTPPGYLAAPSHTWNPSNVEHDSISRLPHNCHTWLTNAAYHHETAQDIS